MCLRGCGCGCVCVCVCVCVCACVHICVYRWDRMSRTREFLPNPAFQVKDFTTLFHFNCFCIPGQTSHYFLSKHTTFQDMVPSLLLYLQNWEALHSITWSRVNDDTSRGHLIMSQMFPACCDTTGCNGVDAIWYVCELCTIWYVCELCTVLVIKGGLGA